MKNFLFISSHDYLKGFTIVEFLIYMGILVILLTALTSVFTSILDVSSESQASSAVERNGKYILAKLAYDIHQATGSGVLSPVLGSSSGSLKLSLGGITSTYSTNNSGNLQVTSNLGTDFLSSYDASVSGLTFTTLGNSGGKNSVQISFTLTSLMQRISGNETANFSTTVGTR